ncbi:MAG: Sapep family Mn(2+)-dependent dipeptidase, partial [Clostridiales bacterium]|nr:Sapep family Mn(2+)-dependent dipeptidase [Clostridiales bacterium]
MYFKQAIDALIPLVQIASEQSEPRENAPFGLPVRLALDYVLNLARSLGFPVVNDVDGYAAEIEFGTGDECVGILAHLDVVPVGSGWSHLQGELADNSLYGRGVTDDKGPALLCLYAMKELMDSKVPLKKRVRLILGCNEESGMGCMEHYARVRSFPDVGFSPDAHFPIVTYEKELCWFAVEMPVWADFKAKVAGISGGSRPNVVPAFAEYTLANGKRAVFTGRAAHGSTPELGENAVHKLLVALAAEDIDDPGLYALSKKFAAPDYLKRLGLDFTHPESGAQTLNLGLIEYKGGDTLTLHFDARCAEQMNGSLVQSVVLCHLPAGTASRTLFKDARLKADVNGFLVKTLKAVYERNTGKPAENLVMGGGTYARKMPNCVAFG